MTLRVWSDHPSLQGLRCIEALSDFIEVGGEFAQTVSNSAWRRSGLDDSAADRSGNVRLTRRSSGELRAKQAADWKHITEKTNAIGGSAIARVV